MEGGIQLTQEMVLVLIVLSATIGLFVSELVRVDIAAILVMVAIGLLGLVPSRDLFNGFASNAVISIIAVMILGAGLDRTGAMTVVSRWILKVGGKTVGRIVPLVSGTVGLISGIMQNVGATALFLPVMSRISSRTEIPLSRLLMPMGTCAILGGTLTMVGSSPLILLNDLILNANETLPPGVPTLEPFHLFSVTPVGFVLLIAGILYFLTVGSLLLPKPRERATGAPAKTKAYFADVYGIEGDLFELLVTVDSPLVGMTVADAEKMEGGPLLLAIRNTDKPRLAPPSDEMIWVGTILGVMGTREIVGRFALDNECRVQPRLRTFGALFNPSRAGISEVVIPPGSRLVGQTIGEARLRTRYGISVLAVNRRGDAIIDSVRDIELETGDCLVSHSTWRDLSTVSQERDFVVATDIPKEEQRPQKVGWALLFFAISMSLVIFSDFRLSVSLLVGAMGMVLSGVLNIDEAYESVSWKTVFLLASLIPLGLAMERTSTAAWIAQEIMVVLGDVPELAIQVALAVLATVFSLVMSNVGATTILVPIAVSIALATGASPTMYALIVALSTSNAFILPTHQVNALIMGPGGYRVADFIRVGTPMSVIFIVVMLTMVNLVF
ncbi:MAG: SLC13 family permease [Xanthomonadales bacterium]|nr:SLC13 family permease [Gammaproteobacteria bacterium]MBT8051321.1 SLC13 family permease [Gammaproteobacteria bacterium]MBT8057336.1 SLC13 family permease [Gammaproteobacteria bacterium]NNJ77777.1 SLC13 family permease [Xanthomonadales bacterium]NNL04684.1 SLC13 family permease [Xanthomonadales bacterium]